MSRRVLGALVAGLLALGGAALTLDRVNVRERDHREPDLPSVQTQASSAGHAAASPSLSKGRNATSGAAAGASPDRSRACRPEPHPCGTVWPPGLEGPFALREVRRVQVESHDGVLLDGWLGFPDLPPGVVAPVVLNSTPYLSTCIVHPTSTGCLRNPGVPEWWNDGPMQEDQAFAGLGVQPIRWIQRGYVVATFSLRGTGHSGGCFETGGPAEQLDQARLVDWLGSQPWSNGRVGMGGLSYPGWTTWQAAVQSPAALKAIVSVAPVTDFYELLFSPQGARNTASLAVLSSLTPQYSNPSVNDDLATMAGPLVDRADCPPTDNALVSSPVGYASGERPASFFEPRDLTPRLGDVRAAVLHAQGYSDFAHYFQDRTLGVGLRRGTPVRELRGWWFHEFPNGLYGNKAFAPPPRAGEQSWEGIVTSWFDYWLKGVGGVPPLGVDHQDQLGTWHQSKQWPPTKTVDHELAVGPVDLLLAPVFHEISLASITFAPELGGGGSLCTSSPPGLPTLSAAFSETAQDDLLIAGNPYLDLTVTSARPAGLIDVALYAVEPGFSCPSLASPAVRWLAGGGADLAHHASRYEARPFAVGKPTRLRIDISDVTAKIPKGHRLVVVLTDGAMLHTGERDAYPGVVTIHEGSRLVVPLAQR